MAEFRICIAGYTSRITSLFDSTRDYCRKYLTEETPGWDISVTREDLDFCGPRGLFPLTPAPSTGEAHFAGGSGCRRSD